MKKGYFSAETSSQDRKIPIKDKNGKGKELTLKDYVCITPKGKKEKECIKIGKVVLGTKSGTSETNPKVILIEELFWNNGVRALRFGYRTVTHEKKLWWWGESALMAPIDDIKELLELAKEKGLLST